MAGGPPSRVTRRFRFLFSRLPLRLSANVESGLRNISERHSTASTPYRFLFYSTVCCYLAILHIATSTLPILPRPPDGLGGHERATPYRLRGPIRNPVAPLRIRNGPCVNQDCNLLCYSGCQSLDFRTVCYIKQWRCTHRRFTGPRKRS